jgi:hypothetical protein
VATEERVMALLAEANPVPDVEALPLTGIDSSEYLAAIHPRSSGMLRTDMEAERIPETRRNPSTTLALAAAVVLILGTVSLMTLGRGESDVTAGVTVVRDFAAAVSSGTIDLDGLVTEGATFGPMTVPLDDDLAAFWAGLETEITLNDCRQSAQVVRCEYEWRDVIRRAQDRPEHGSLTFLIADSRIAAVSRDWDQEASGWIDAGDPVIHYLLWLNENHPGWDSGLTWVGEPLEIGGGYAPLAHADPVLDAMYAASLTRHLDEYRESLATGLVVLPAPGE